MVQTNAPLHCPHFGRCGGCSALDVPIETQLQHKQARARELLRPFLGDVDPAVTLPPRTPRHDRSQILYPVQPHPRLGVVLGIYRQGSHDVEDIRDCRIQQKALTLLGIRAGEAFRALKLHAYDETTGRGLLRGFRARVTPGGNELLAGVVTTRTNFTERDKLAAKLWDAMQGLKDEQGRPLRPVGLVLNHNDRKGNVLLGAESTALYGRTFQTDETDGLRLRVSFASFYQQNRHAAAILYRPALALLGDVQGQRIVDGYGGVGSFGLRLAKAGAAAVTIVESAPSAVADARWNVGDNALGNVDVVDAAFAQAEFAPPDLLVVDPPRAGLQRDGVDRVVAAGPARVLLVSCALESLARDLSLLDPRYKVLAVQLVDLFPHTEHVEVLTLLQRRW